MEARRELSPFAEGAATELDPLLARTLEQNALRDFVSKQRGAKPIQKHQIYLSADRPRDGLGETPQLPGGGNGCGVQEKREIQIAGGVRLARCHGAKDNRESDFGSIFQNLL